MPNNEEDYLNKLLQSVNAGEAAPKKEKDQIDAVKDQISKEVQEAVKKTNDSQVADDIEEKSDDFNDKNNESESLNLDDFDFENDAGSIEDIESTSMINAMDDILNGYNDSDIDINDEIDADALNTNDLETADIGDFEIDDLSNGEDNTDNNNDISTSDLEENINNELDNEPFSDENDNKIDAVEEELNDNDLSDDKENIENELSESDEKNKYDSTDLEIDSLMSETEEIDDSEILNPEDIAASVTDDSDLDETKKEAAAEEEIDKMLDDTDLSEAEDVEITAEDMGGELSDSDIERLVNMDLDNIIDDATSDSVSVEELFGDDSSDVNGETEDVVETKKKKKKNKGENISGVDDLEDHGVQAKKGFLSKLKDIFFESLEEEDFEEEKPKAKKKSKSLDENERILQEVDKETSDDSAPKKGFFAKFKYRLAQWKKKQAEEEKLEEEQEAIEAEEAKKAKEEKKAEAEKAKEAKKEAAAEKPKKEKKEKKPKEPKPKKEKKPKPEPQPGDILKIKPVSMILFILFVAGVIVLLLVLIKSVNYNNSSHLAKTYFAKGDYQSAYEQLDGLSLNESDETLYEQARTILYVQCQYKAYTNYVEMKDATEALNSLIKGVMAYDKYCDQAQSLGVGDEFDAAYEEILEALENTFSIGEAKAYSLVEMYESDFTNYYFVIIDYGKAAGIE